MNIQPRQRMVKRDFHGQVFGFTSVVLLVLTAGLTGLTGQLASVVAGQGWPSWHGIGINVWAPIIGVYVHADDPMRGWPGLPGDHPGPAVFWVIFAFLMVVAAALAAVAFRVFHGLGNRRPGFASRRAVSKRLSERALVKQAGRLRPELIRTNPRPVAAQLGVYRGRDVNTGVDCYSSVRQSMYVVGPSESGKTACVVIPEVLDHDGPLLAASSRADVMSATWKSRAERGQVLLFDPLNAAPGLPLVRWDLVRSCVDAPVAMRRAKPLMSRVDMSAVQDGDVWKQRGESVLRNLLHAAALDGQDIRTVLRWAHEPTDRAPINILSRSSVTPESWADQQRRAAQAPDRQRDGIYMTVEAAVAMFAHPAVLATCLPSAGQHFDPALLVDGGSSTLYTLTQRSDSVAAVDLTAALMDEIVTIARAKGQRCENNRLDPAFRIVADEAANNTTYQGMPDLISDGGGRGIPTTMVLQDRSDAVERWGPNNARRMWGAATIRMVLPGVSGYEELREIALYADDVDEQVHSHSQGTSGYSQQTSIRSRPALTPAMVRALSPMHALILAAGGLKPVITKLTPYYQRDDAKQSAESERLFYSALNEERSVQ